MELFKNAYELDQKPEIQVDASAYRGEWIAVRDGTVITGHNRDPAKLYSDPNVLPGDVFVAVPSSDSDILLY